VRASLDTSKKSKGEAIYFVSVGQTSLLEMVNICYLSSNESTTTHQLTSLALLSKLGLACLRLQAWRCLSKLSLAWFGLACVSLQVWRCLRKLSLA